MQRMTYKTALDNLCVNYGKYGFTREKLKELLDSGIREGFSVRSAYNGIRLGFGMCSGEHELFSSEEVAECLGESVETINAQVEQLTAELIAQGKDPNDYVIPRQQRQVVYMGKL